MPKPLPETYFPYFKKYVDQVAEEDLTTAFNNQLPVIRDLLNSITEERKSGPIKVPKAPTGGYV
jgi:hypothetical protein